MQHYNKDLLNNLRNIEDIEALSAEIVEDITRNHLIKKSAIFILKPNGQIKSEVTRGFLEEELNELRKIIGHIQETYEYKGNLIIPLKGYGFTIAALIVDNHKVKDDEDFNELLSLLPPLFGYYTLKDFVYTDPLTNLPNLQYLKLRADEQLHRFYRYEEDFSLVVLEIKGYSELSETYGIQFAEKVLIKVDEILQKLVRKSDILASMGLNQFAILMSHTTLEGAKVFADRIKSTFKFQAIEVMGKRLEVGLYMGITSTTIDQYGDVDEVFARVMESLEHDKRRTGSKKAGGSRKITKNARVFLKEREIVGESRAIKNIKNSTIVAAQNDLPVLLLGETGTGKELVARKIHELSQRRDNAFVVIDCGSIPDTLLESELFGHEKGAFTGAISRKRGLFEVADGGTIFLDEVEATSVSMQSKILRAIEEKTIRRVGGTSPISINTRIIAASNVNLETMIENGKFRKDLFYRLAGITIEIPALWERKSDIPILVKYFLKRASIKLGKRIDGVSKKVMDAFLSYKWPGNVRELEHEVERAAAFCSDGDRLRFRHLSDRIKKRLMKSRDLRTLVDEFEKSIIIESLEEVDWNETETSRRLGITRTTLISKMRKYSIELPINKTKQRNNL